MNADWKKINADPKSQEVKNTAFNMLRINILEDYMYVMFGKYGTFSLT